MGRLAVFRDGLFVEAQKMLVSFQRPPLSPSAAEVLVRFNSSLYTALHSSSLGKIEPRRCPISPKFNVGYLACAAIWAVSLLGLVEVEGALLGEAGLVTALMILLPQSSADYRLVMLYPPLMAFLNNTGHRQGWIRLQILVFGLLLVPKSLPHPL